MRLRQRKLELMQSNKGTLKEEESSILAAFDQSLGQSMAQSRKSIGRTIDQTNQWIADSAKNLNQSSIHDANQLYLQSIYHLAKEKFAFRKMIQNQDL